MEFENSCRLQCQVSQIIVMGTNLHAEVHTETMYVFDQSSDEISLGMQFIEDILP